jgi:hypothetical protein
VWIMTVLRDVSEPEHEWIPSVAFGDLLDDKAWQHLGLTGEEFRRRWYAGEFSQDSRPAVLALDELMRTGEWHMP